MVYIESHLRPSSSSNPPITSKSPLPASLQPFPLAAYLTGAVGSTFLISAPQAEAAVTSVTFGFGSVLSTSSNLDGNTTPSSTSPFYGNIIAFGGTFSGGTEIVSLASYFELVDVYTIDPYGPAKFLANGTVVSGGANGSIGESLFKTSLLPAKYQITTDQLNKNIGFQTSTGNWGWANVSWNATAKALTFHSAYVESVAGNTITVDNIGAVPEPSRALLALAGLGAAALRRRRKQAA